MDKLIPEVIPISQLVRSIKTGRAKFFVGIDPKSGENMTFEANWDPKSALNDVLAKVLYKNSYNFLKVKVYKLELKQLRDENSTLQELTNGFVDEINQKESLISQLKKVILE